MKKIIIMMVSFALLATLSVTASAESITDPTGDVFHWTGSNYMDWSWDVSDKPNIDITEITYSPGSQLTISMKVAGSIRTEKSWYHAYFNTSTAYYHLSFAPDDDSEPNAFAYPTNFDEMSLDDMMNYTEPSVVTSVTGNTISATIDWVTDSHEMVEFWAWAQQWDDEGEAWSDYYIDFAPNEYSYFGEYEDYYDGGDTGGGDTGGGDTGGGDTGGGDTGGGDTGGGDTGGGDTGSGSLTDPANDVYKPGGQTGISSQQHLDIREISYAFDDNGLTLTMELQGTVSDDVTYTVTLDTADASYDMIYDYGGWSSVAASEAGEFIPYFQGAEYGTVSGNTITMLFDRVGSSTTAVDFWGQALELGGARDDVPNETGGGGSNTPTPTGTPGFELVFLIAAIGLLFVILRKRR